ncbi:2-succinyl-5-enolpyruvyl-6-hydroxy-3-cyclohexene-1-carboxylate synthase [Klebsiella pneumoniae]|uniref:2-succinyl-5-enolpyruvyl-6-hydroxy-3-cyclohexene-1-carboxylate synthase n=1 Tax=Klebsiella pneumoniae TaxID=573 RepID=A0A377XQ43_KLEPN|nr:2-succinyl-5-enolpyruvyl-6-hydroxy-3-cyclohexene-1-carboxylate synthase [Klebsiella pneumoniae]
MSAAEGKKVAEWAQTLGWPLIGDVLSQTGQPLPCADLWLGNGKAVSELAQAQIVVQLGSSLTGKRVLQWQATCEPDEYWLVDNLPGRRLLSSVERWLELHPAEKRQPWATVIPQLAGQAWQAAVASNEPFGEAQLAQRIRGYLPEQGQLFVGNSLVVRLIDALAQLPAGVSGLQQPRRQRHRWPDRHCGRRAARQRPTDAGHRWRSLRALRSQLAGPAAPGVGAAGADRGE